MTRYANAHQVVPVEPLVPSFLGLNRLDMVDLAGDTVASVQASLALVPTRLQLSTAQGSPVFGVAELSILGIIFGPLGVICTVILFGQVLIPPGLFRLPFRLSDGGAVRAVGEAMQYNLPTPWACLVYRHAAGPLSLKRKKDLVLSA